MPFKTFGGKPLSRIFGATPPAAPAGEAAAADRIASLDSAPPELIAATALADGEESMRAAAILKLEDVEPLRALAGLAAGDSRSVAPNLARIAQQRLAQLVDAGSLDFGRLCAPVDNIDAVLAVAGYSRDPAHAACALALIGDPKRVSALVLGGATIGVRQLAAQSITDPAELRHLLKELRGKDKSVYKIIAQKCEELRAEEHRLEQIQSDIVAACESLERHSHRVYEVIYEPSFRHFLSKWQALEAQAPPDVSERAGRAIRRCQEIIDEHLNQLAREAAHEAEHAARQAAREQAAVQAELESRQRSDAAALAAAETAARREAVEQARAERSAADALALRQIGALLGKAQGALREGNTGRASGLRRSLGEKLAGAPALPAHIARQVQQLDAKLNELKEWKEHAAAPKRAELIADMEALIGSPEAPQALADRIKQLQEDWKTVSKGVVIDSDADWQRFHQASVQAYQPCREYFDAQTKLREGNAVKRRGVLERLRAFESTQSGEHPDWRMVATVLREAPEEWRRYFPVDRAAARALQREFDAAIARLQSRLEAWHEQNTADKKQLIQRAQQMVANEDGREAVDGIKRLQSQWKEVGPARRDQEQALWSAFREQCDAVFQKRHQAHAQHSALLEANRAAAVALCAEAEETAGRTGPALIEAAGKIPELRTAYDALGELPRTDQRALKDRFERGLKLVQTAMAKQREREKERSFAHLFEAARHVHAYGWSVAQAAPDVERDALKQAAEAFIAGVETFPKGGADALKLAWAKAGSAAAPDAAAHETALRMLCIRSEILADRPTPPEDQPLRREYQMQRLVQQRMGQGVDARVDEPGALALEWVSVGPVAPPVFESLLARFRGNR